MEEPVPIYPTAGRKTPSQGARISLDMPNVFFLTVNAKNRLPWLAQEAVHESLRQIWKEADAWLVGDYLLMPDHVHLFCAPRNLQFTMERWMVFWKTRFSRQHLDRAWKWQRAGFHHRLRNGEEFAEKWAYVQQNPVRKGLVKRPEDWLFQGRIYEVGW